MSQAAALRPLAAERWDRRAAAHLLRRAQFGASNAEIDAAFDAGLAKTIDRLVQAQPEAEEFRRADGLLKEAALGTGNIADLKAWWLHRMLYSANPLVEKMTLLWHNHFATSNSKVKSAAHMAVQNALLRRYALGDFPSLLQEISKDPAMLIWLDGSANKKRQPNENYARELMELFSLGVGNYTEKDIQEAARAFTGWGIRHDQFWFDPTQHDPGPKKVLGKAGPLNGDDVVRICLEHGACPRFLAMKILRTFVIGEPVEADIALLAGRIRALNFKMDAVLREVLGSELFFSERARHSIIKSPIDLVLGTFRALEIRPKFQETRGILARLGQDVFEPPTVKGWDGGRLWIDSSMLLLRSNFAAAVTQSNRFGELPDPVATLSREKVTDSSAIVGYFTELLLGREAEPATRRELIQYVENTTGDRGQRLRGLIHLVLTIPEYQLC